MLGGRKIAAVAQRNGTIRDYVSRPSAGVDAGLRARPPAPLIPEAPASPDDDPDKPVGAAPLRGLGKSGAKYRRGGFIRHRDKDFDPRSAGAHRGGADTVYCADRERDQIGGPPREEPVEQRPSINSTQTRPARRTALAHQARPSRLEYVSPRVNYSILLGHITRSIAPDREISITRE